MILRRTNQFIVFLSCICIAPLCLAQEEADTESEDVPVVEGLAGKFNHIEEDGVLILTKDNFDYVVVSRPYVLVEFYAPWCGHCQSLAPEYSKAAEILKKENITLAKVDATRQVDLAKTYEVTGYPTILLFAKGEKIDDYQGQRSANAIVDYVRQKTNPDWQPPPPAVMVLTADNFTKIVNQKDIILVEFYAPWCRHCKELEPEYEGAARTLQQYGIPLAKVDGPKEKELAEAHQVTGWPTLKVFRKGRAFSYKGPRENVEIVKYMRELAKPASREVRTSTEAKNGLERTEATVVGFFSGKTDLYEEYLAAAEDLRGILPCLHTFNEDVAQFFDVKMDSIVVFQPEIFQSQYEQHFYELTRPAATSKDILEFIQKHSVPLVGQRTKRNEAFKYSSRPLIIVYYDVNFSHQYVKDTQFIRKKVLQVAKEFRNTNVRFCISNEDEYEKELESLHFTDATEDVKVAALELNAKYRMDPVDDFEPEDLKDFVDKLMQGKLKPFYKSQPIPKKQDGPVRVIVGNSFTTEVLDSKKDILLEFYAPWCGHCKALEPTYAKLARKMAKENPNLVIAKMDATANDLHPMFGELQGYPTVFFIPAFNKEAFVQYSGKHTYKDLKEFVEENATNFPKKDEL